MKKKKKIASSLESTSALLETEPVAERSLYDNLQHDTGAAYV